MVYTDSLAVLRCAHGAGVAVLEAIEEDGLQQHAHEVGAYLIQQLEALQKVTSPSMPLSGVMLHVTTCGSHASWPEAATHSTSWLVDSSNRNMTCGLFRL